MKIEIAHAIIRPQAFLRWAGGKVWLASKLSDIFGELKFARYHEPFLGGGSIFFVLNPTSASYLSDKNEILIEAYSCLRDDPGKIIDHMRTFENTEAFYYNMRRRRFSDPFARSAQFIYLNQTSFNGIYRVNLQGVYNVPYGHRSKAFLDEKAILAASIALKNATIKSSDFEDTLNDIEEDDLVFIDPPYTVSHNKNGFIKYNKSLFSVEDQIRLAQYIREIKKLGANYIMTNAAHDRIKEIFDIGDRIFELERASLIGGKQAKRGPVSELMFSNLDLPL